MTDEVVIRLYRALIEALRRRGHAPDRPVKVAEIYKELVPYGAVRGRLGVELNADYEHALMRLLSGERNLLRLEPAHARNELREEVQAPYPQVGLFRKFAASNVWVERPEELAGASSDSGPAGRSEPGSPEAGSPGSGTGEPGSPRVADLRSRTSGPTRRGGLRIAAEGESGPVAHGSAAAERAPVRLHPGTPESDPSERMIHGEHACPFCHDTLPQGRSVRFCPHCGGDQRLRPCPRCDAVLERGWQYCISCGHETTD